MSPDNTRLRTLVPQTIGVLCRRGADFPVAEDAVQEALVEAVSTRTNAAPRDLRAWLITVSWRKFLDTTRSESARRSREDRIALMPEPGVASNTDDTLWLYFLCAHPDLSPASAVALTLRAIGGLTTAQIAEAYMVPEATMAQRISRAKRALTGKRFTTAGDAAVVCRVLYLIFNEGHSGQLDLAEEAIRLGRMLRSVLRHPEVDGLLALMLLHHARHAARFDDLGQIVALPDQDRRLWDSELISEGIGLLQAALARDRLGEYQAQAAIAALHADAPTFSETDWPQICGWYEELVTVSDSPVARLNHAVALGHAEGARAGLAALAEVDPALPRYTAVAAYLHELAGERARAVELYVQAADRARSEVERTHLVKQAARLRSSPPGR